MAQSEEMNLLEKEITELGILEKKEKKTIIDQMVVPFMLLNLRLLAADCKSAGIPDPEIEKILGSYAKIVLSEEPITTHISGTM